MNVYWGALLFTIVVVGVIFGIAYLLFGPGDYSTNCVNAGGHIYSPGGISFCLTEDGRMLEVYR